MSVPSSTLENARDTDEYEDICDQYDDDGDDNDAHFDFEKRKLHSTSRSPYSNKDKKDVHENDRRSPPLLPKKNLSFPSSTQESDEYDDIFITIDDAETIDIQSKSNINESKKFEEDNNVNPEVVKRPPRQPMPSFYYNTHKKEALIKSHPPVSSTYCNMDTKERHEKFNYTNEYEDIYDDAVSSLTLPNTNIEESTKSEDDDNTSHPVIRRKPPPPIPFPHYRRKSPLPPPNDPREMQKKLFISSLPLVPLKDRESAKQQKPDDDNRFINDPLKRSSHSVLSESKENPADVFDKNSCLSLPLPIIPALSDRIDGKDLDVNVLQTKSSLPLSLREDNIKLAKMFPLSPRPPKPNSTKSDSITEFVKVKNVDSIIVNCPGSPRSHLQAPDGNPIEQHSVAPNENQSIFTDRKADRGSSLDSVYKGSDFYETVPSVIPLDSENNGSDFCGTVTSEIPSRDSMYKGSDFYGTVSSSENMSNGRGDTNKRTDSDQIVQVGNDNNINVKPMLAIKTKPKVLPKPKAKPRIIFNNNGQDKKAHDASPSEYINQIQSETKPVVPSRIP